MPTREIYWNIEGEGLIYLFALVALLCLGAGIYRRLRLWRLGGPEARFDRLPTRLGGLLLEVFTHRRLLRDPFAGLAHLFIVVGFLAQLLATLLIAVQESSGFGFLLGRVYLWYSLLTDLFGILGVVGLCMALWHRVIRRPGRLHSLRGDWLAFALLLVIFVQGFVIEGIRIAVTELGPQPDLAIWSPGGHALALIFQDVDPERLRSFHRFHWWFHVVTVFCFLALLGYRRINHILYGAANVLLRTLEPTGKLTRVDLEARPRNAPEAFPALGVGRIDQFTWKSLLDLDACMGCGRCEVVCPAHLSRVPLSPKKLIRDMRQHLTRVGPPLLRASSSAGGAPDGASEELDLPPLCGHPVDGALHPAVLEEEVWGCRTCGACQRECPVHVEHIPKIIDMRRYLVTGDAQTDEEVGKLLRALDDRMRPWVDPPHGREDWFADLDVKVLGRGERAEHLFWVGCAGAFVDRNIEVTRAMVQVLQAADVDFAVLGEEEVCTGDPARRVGGERTFQTCARQNIETFSRYGVRKILTTCPHCFNSLANEYPDFGGRYEVIHHTQLIADLIRDGRLNLKGKLDSLTYHDPCYLGRHNGVYQAPRAILHSLSEPGAVRELERNRSRALCCGAGGGYVWMDDRPSRPIHHSRFEEIKRSGARTAAASCPFCLQRLDEARQVLDPRGALRVVDIAELVAEALEP